MSDINEMNVGPRWYVAHTYSGYENKVKANLEKIVENRGLGNLIYDIKVPVETVVEKDGDKEKEVEKSETTMDYTGETVNFYQLSLATVTSNYSISDLTVVVKDADGKQVFRKLTNIHDTSPNHRTASVGVAATAMDLSKFADGKHTIEISARIGTGEKPVVYTGTLVN